MLRFIRRAVTFAVFLFVFATACVWLFFVAPFFEERRQALAERVLSLELERPVSVDGHVQLRLADTLQLVLFDVSIPHSEQKGVRLATADRLELDVDLGVLRNRQLVFDHPHHYVPCCQPKSVGKTNGARSPAPTLIKSDHSRA